MRNTCLFLLGVVLISSASLRAGDCEDACAAARAEALVPCFIAKENAILLCNKTYYSALENSIQTLATDGQRCNAAHKVVVDMFHQEYMNCMEAGQGEADFEACRNTYKNKCKPEDAKREQCIRDAKTAKQMRDVAAYTAWIACAYVANVAYIDCEKAADAAYESCVEDCSGE